LENSRSVVPAPERGPRNQLFSDKYKGFKSKWNALSGLKIFFLHRTQRVALGWYGDAPSGRRYNAEVAE
jgi:hypothetical protein